MHYLKNNYPGAYHHVTKVKQKLLQLEIDTLLIHKYMTLMTVGCPNHWDSSMLWENALLHWRCHNGPTIDKKLDQVWATMNKETHNQFVISLPRWLAWDVPYLFFMQQHILKKTRSKGQAILWWQQTIHASLMSSNMMMSTTLGSEECCLVGDTWVEIYQWIHNLEIPTLTLWSMLMTWSQPSDRSSFTLAS